MSPIFTHAAELYREMRDEFELSVEAAHAAAEEGTNGAMLNKHGRAEGIDAYSLMTGPWSRVERYGSPELIEWCEENGRPSVARFEREWFASWQGDLPEPDADLAAVIDTAIEAAGPPRMMDREDACNTLNKVLDQLRAASQTWIFDRQPVASPVLPPNTPVQLHLEEPSYWDGDKSWPGLAFGHIIGVETTNMEHPVYRVRVVVKGVETRFLNVLPESFHVVKN